MLSIQQNCSFDPIQIYQSLQLVCGMNMLHRFVGAQVWDHGIDGLPSLRGILVVQISRLGAELFTFLGCISRFRTETAPLCTSPETRLNLEQQMREGWF